MTQHIIDTDELEKLPKYGNDGFDNITRNENGWLIYVDDLRALIANSPQVDGMVLALSNTELKKRIAVLEDLLSSAYNIANRNGEHTHWERFAGQLHINGISPITAKTFKILPSDTELSAYKPQADDVRKDAERYQWLCENKLMPWGLLLDDKDLYELGIDQAIDKARE